MFNFNFQFRSFQFFRSPTERNSSATKAKILKLKRFSSRIHRLYRSVSSSQGNSLSTSLRINQKKGKQRKRFWTRWVFSEQIAFSPQRLGKWFRCDLTLIFGLIFVRMRIDLMAAALARARTENLHFNGILMLEINRECLIRLIFYSTPRVMHHRWHQSGAFSGQCRHRSQNIYRSHKRPNVRILMALEACDGQ